MKRFFMASSLFVIGIFVLIVASYFWIEVNWDFPNHNKTAASWVTVGFLVGWATTIYSFFTMITKKGFIPRVFKWLFSFVPFKVVKK